MSARLLLVTLLAVAVPAAAADTLVARASATAVRGKVLQLVNQARAQGRRCGGEYFAAATPLAVARPLREAAEAHARDMARHGYFDHRARDGSQPKDRVRRAGYQPRLTGENIAFAPESAEEVVAGWLASPGHCANIMDARFSDTGIAFASGRQRGHIYWVQTFGAPQQARR